MSDKSCKICIKADVCVINHVLFDAAENTIITHIEESDTETAQHLVGAFEDGFDVLLAEHCPSYLGV
jgi:hypothetical protein